MVEALTCSFLLMCQEGASTKARSRLARRDVIDHRQQVSFSERTLCSPASSGLKSRTSAIVKTINDGGPYGPDVGWRIFTVGMFDRRVTVSMYPVLHNNDNIVIIYKKCTMNNKERQDIDRSHDSHNHRTKRPQRPRKGQKSDVSEFERMSKRL